MLGGGCHRILPLGGVVDWVGRVKIEEDLAKTGPKVGEKQGPSGQKPGILKSGPKSWSKVSPNKRAPQTDFIHAGLAQIDFKCEFAKVVKNAVQGAPH